MKGIVRTLLSVLVLGAGLTVWAQGQGKAIKYNVDAATATPAATVVKNGDGVVVVTFRTAFVAGATFSFRLDMMTRSSKPHFPVQAEMTAKGSKWLSAAFSPAEVEFTGANVTVSTVVTVTLMPVGSSNGRLKLHIKAGPAAGGHLGEGAGVNVVVVGGSRPAATPEERMLQDVVDALAPDEEP